MFYENGGLRCERSLELSVKDTERLIAWAHSPPTQDAYKLRVGGEWYCPACGGRCIERRKGLVSCTGCGRSLHPLIRSFVERFFHADVGDES